MTRAWLCNCRGDVVGSGGSGSADGGRGRGGDHCSGVIEFGADDDVFDIVSVLFTRAWLRNSRGCGGGGGGGGGGVTARLRGD